MEIRARHWLIALTMAGAAHGSLLLLPIQSTPRQAPEPVYRIQLAAAEPLGAGSDKSSGDADASPTSVQAPAQPAATPASVSVTPPRVPKEIPKFRKRETVQPKPPPKPKVKPKKKAPPKEAKRPIKARQLRPKPSPVQASVRQAAKRATKADSSSARSTPASSASRRSGTGTQASPDRSQTGRGRAGSGQGSGKRGGNKGSSQISARRYYGTLAAWLARHKRYPGQARRRQEQGTVRVTFTIDRHGRLLSHRIAASSGHPVLDQEVKAMLKRASPMPPIPAALGKSRLTITVPISFTLR